MTRLIILDADGALVSDGSLDLDPEVFDTILRLRGKGMQFVVASGRPWTSVESAFKPVKKKVFYVANNGAYVDCHGRCLYAYIMDHQLTHCIIRRVRMYPELKVAYAGVNGGYLDSKGNILYDWLTNNCKFNIIRVRDVLKLEEPCAETSIYKKKGVEAVTRDIYEEFRDQAKMACTDDMWMDCMVRNMNRGRVVHTVQESLGIKMGETMTFRDQFNDIEMLNQAYYNFVITDARGEVCRAIRLQAGNNVRGGALKILKGLLRKERGNRQKQDIRGTGEGVGKDFNAVPSSSPGTDCFCRVFREDSCNNQLQNRG